MTTRVSHLYTHIPFCPKKCSYCAFVTHVGSLKHMSPYLDAVVREAEQAHACKQAGPLTTVYVGGGTPSLMSPDEVRFLLSSFDRLFGIEDDVEITLEAHPSTVDVAKLRGFRQAGVNRISFGAESLDAGELAALGREHSADRVRAVVDMARDAGFANVNLDLMYGLPRQTIESWVRTLRGLIDISPDHVSLYPLAIEPRTVFARRWRERTIQLPTDETVGQMYHLACEALTAETYGHYEVSNWSRPGRECRHNLACWRDEEYLGLGVGAHAYLKPYRTENISQTKKYIEAIARGANPIAHRELVDRDAELVETVMLGLRLLREGLDIAALAGRFGSEAARRLHSTADELEQLGLVRTRSDRVWLQEAAVPVANEVWERFL